MGGFVTAATSFPTVVLTPVLIVVIGYWLVAVLGGLGPDGDGESEGGALGFLGFDGVPAPVALSLLVAFAWFAGLAGSQLPGAVPRWLVLAGALAAGWLLMRLVVLAVRRFVPAAPEPSRSDFLGRTCVIRTGRVTDTFGQAEVHSADGSSAIVQVRQAGTDDLRAGTLALLYDVDVDRGFFWVVPADIATK